jgi:cellulose synthase/poly-beta-1,6-N-acetylglucosamine synthase-like glycosyltransferase
MLAELFFLSLAFFFTIYGGYFAYIRHHAKKPWNLKLDSNFQPFLSILVPAHNEESAIEEKLANLRAVSYPKNKIEFIIVDDSSEDNTLEKIEHFIAVNPDLNMKVVKQNPRAGKSAALNSALQSSSHSIVIVTDADTLWPSETLEKAMPYLADPEIGAISGRGANENKAQSWTTEAEETYLNYTNMIRVGESKIHSTIRFEGGFCAYKKGTFNQFDSETGSDDSGTALDVVQHNHRAILVPEVLFSTKFPTNLSGRIHIKARRATQLVGLWVKCLKLMAKRQLVLPKRIVIPELLLFIFNPLAFAVLLSTLIGLAIVTPLPWFLMLCLVSIGILIVFARRLSFEIVLDNLILLYAVANSLMGRRYVAWQKTEIGTN